MENSIEAAGIVDGLLEPDYPMFISSSIFIPTSVFSGLVLLICLGSRENKNEC
jgi:hypothetical protein